jgi:hypothetical protein
MDQESDLQKSLDFVSRRIEEEGMRSGEPLTKDQKVLLEHLPTESVHLNAFYHDVEDLQLLPPRDFDYERLCALTKAAHRNDLQLNPGDNRWLFAKAVTERHKHPVSWLLDWAGVKLRRPWWDKFLLVGGALASIILWMVLVFIGLETHMRFRWLVMIAGAAVLIVAIGLGTRWSERSQLGRSIEKYRQA